MSYSTAKKCFVENINFVTPPGNDLQRSLHYNLNNGLSNFASAVSSDISGLEQRLANIERLLSKIARQQ